MAHTCEPREKVPEEVPGVGFEPTRPLGQSGLSRSRLTEFRHPGSFKYGRRLGA